MVTRVAITRDHVELSCDLFTALNHTSSTTTFRFVDYSHYTADRLLRVDHGTDSAVIGKHLSASVIFPYVAARNKINKSFPSDPIVVPLVRYRSM